MRRSFLAALSLSLLAGSVACSWPQQVLATDSNLRNWPKQLVLGTYPSELPSEELEKIDPVRRGLEKRLAAAGFPVAIEIQIFRSYEEALQLLVGGRVDFVRLGPVSYVLARRHDGRLKLLGMETQNHSKTLTGYIFVHARSSVRSLRELRGRSVAFGSENSTTGRYFPQSALVDAGVHARDLAGFRYLGRHDRVLRAVGPAGFDAGASNEVTFDKYAVEKRLRVIHTMRSPAHAWVAKAGLPDFVTERLREALLAATERELAGLSRDGIVGASDQDFESVRKAMLNAERFGG